ncbi:MAG: hypothetical protein ACI9YT_001943 [Halobacteriales archaeon]|jgi:hypothetical protein
MPSHSRRSFLSGTALTLTALTGVLDAGRHLDPPRPTRYSLPSDLESLLEPLPSADAVDVDYRTIVLQDVDGDDASDLPSEARRAVESLDVSSADLSKLVSVYPGDYRRRLGVAAGDFDALADDDGDDRDGGWRITDTGDVGIATVEGRAAFAAGRTADDRIDTAETMAAAATGDVDRFLDDALAAGQAIEALADFDTILFVPDPAGTGYPPVGGDRLQALGAGFEVHPRELEGTAENEYLLFPASDATLDEERARSVVESVDPGVVVEADVSRSGNAVRVEAVVEAAPEYDREAAPDAQIRTTFDRETTTLTFDHEGGEPVPATELELWVDGEIADSQPADEFRAFEPGDSLTVDTGPLGTAVLRWFDEAENVHYVYASETVDREAFEMTHDFESDAVEITYVGRHPADPAKLTVSHRSDDEFRRIEDPFADAGDTLEEGDSMVVENVGVEESVRVELDVPSVPGVHRSPLARLHVSPPRIHLRNHPEKGLIARYYDGRERDADEFRLFADDEPTDVQFADETDTLSEGDAIPLGEFPIGTTLRVEWLEPDDPVVVTEHVVAPQTRVSMEYDEDEGTVRIEHRQGEALPPEDLELRIDMAPADVQPADTLEEFGPGDAFTVEVPPLANVELVWVSDESERHLGGTMTARDAIEARYDPDRETMELTYVGEQAADPERLHVSHGDAPPRTDDAEKVFAREYDELSTGDAVEVDAEIGDRVVISVRSESENATAVRSVAHFSTKPRRGFVFREQDGTIEAVYADRVKRDADEFRLLVDGEPADRQPADVHDTLEREATVELGEFPAGTTLAAEWTPLPDSSTLAEHVVAPEATFDVNYDADDGEIEVVHAGGDAIAPEDLSVVAPPAIPRPTPWEEASDADAGDEVSQGDTATFAVDESPRMVVVLFRENEVLHREELAGTDA